MYLRQYYITSTFELQGFVCVLRIRIRVTQKSGSGSATLPCVVFTAMCLVCVFEDILYMDNFSNTRVFVFIRICLYLSGYSVVCLCVCVYTMCMYLCVCVCLVRQVVKIYNQIQSVYIHIYIYTGIHCTHCTVQFQSLGTLQQQCRQIDGQIQ